MYIRHFCPTTHYNNLHKIINKKQTAKYKNQCLANSLNKTYLSPVL